MGTETSEGRLGRGSGADLRLWQAAGGPGPQPREESCFHTRGTSLLLSGEGRRSAGRKEDGVVQTEVQGERETVLPDLGVPSRRDDTSDGEG